MAKSRQWLGTLIISGLISDAGVLWDRAQTVCRTPEAHVARESRSLATRYMEGVSSSLTNGRPHHLSTTCLNPTRFALELSLLDPVSQRVSLHEMQQFSTMT